MLTYCHGEMGRGGKESPGWTIMAIEGPEETLICYNKVQRVAESQAKNLIAGIEPS